MRRGGEAADSRLTVELGEVPESLKMGKKSPSLLAAEEVLGLVQS